jgi:hypothetical protein
MFSPVELEVARQKLATLAAADGAVELGPFGVAALISPACQAYRDLAANAAALLAMKAEIEALATSGTGAARIYTALLLRTIDRPAGTALLESMQKSQEPCTLGPGGCTIVASTVGQAAEFLLARQT